MKYAGMTMIIYIPGKRRPQLYTIQPFATRKDVQREAKKRGAVMYEVRDAD